MKIGLGPIQLGSVTRSEIESLATSAAAASFDAVWVAESRSAGVGGGIAAAALVAQLVPIRVGAVVDVGGYHPMHLAEDIAVADLASRGRLEVVLRGGPEEHVRLLIAALGGAHLRFNGEELRVPAHLEANAPVPDRLALNPRPAQPVVPMWVLDRPDGLALQLGLGVATTWQLPTPAPRSVGRWPGMLLCDGDVEADAMLQAAGDAAAYFIVNARAPQEVMAAGHRLVGPLRMPGFPGWILGQ